MADEPEDTTIPTSSSNSKENEVPETPPQSVHDGALPLDPVTGAVVPEPVEVPEAPAGADPVEAQGAAAKALRLGENDCPYGDGENKDNWLSGFQTAPDPEPEG